MISVEYGEDNQGVMFGIIQSETQYLEPCELSRSPVQIYDPRLFKLSSRWWIKSVVASSHFVARGKTRLAALCPGEREQALEPGRCSFKS